MAIESTGRDGAASLREAVSDETLAALRWLAAPGIAAIRMRALRETIGSFAAALSADERRLAEALRVSPQRAAVARDAAVRFDPAPIVGAVHAIGGRPIGALDDGYPSLLRAAPDPPPVLFVQGALDEAPEAAVAIVGSRRASGYGRLHAGRIACELAALGVTIVSGGARGIDAEAHRGAMRAGGRTIAVVATGLDRCYPPEHRALFDAIRASGGAVVSEHACGVEARPESFPQRNRIVAGLSLVVVVVEAAARSGALVTARIAVDDLSREVGCLPGPVDSAMSAGCHRAIQEGWARLVTGAEDIARMVEEARSLAVGSAERAARIVRADSLPPPPPTPKPKPRPMSADAAEVLAAIDRTGRAGLDELVEILGWPVPRIATATLELEVARAVVRDSEGAFVRNSDLRS
ncbi:MAG: DNA-processing protein DprA [Planctomycetota bacterium]